MPMLGSPRAFPHHRPSGARPMRIAIVLAAFLAAGCQVAEPRGKVPGEANDPAPYAGIAVEETVHLTGTEPFWGGEVRGPTLTYKTPEQPDGETIAVSRFAGRGGVSWSGTYRGARIALAVTPSQCSDGMSDRTYPFVATLALGDEQRTGCAWTDRQSFSGPKDP